MRGVSGGAINVAFSGFSLTEACMPANTVVIPAPARAEEVRLLAQAVADMHSVLDVIVEHAEELVPGESVNELRGAWFESEASFASLAGSLLVAAQLPVPSPIRNVGQPISVDELEANGLLGRTGQAKR